ncbi:MAG: hypothetical protein WCD18_09370, partial [Thermosynechococcaceae cyanobacterium]
MRVNLHQHKHQQGFALPIAMGVGLTLLLIGASMIVRSQSDSVAAVTQKTTARAQNAAESGIGRFQSLMASYRPIAVYPACNTWSGSSCGDSGSSYSWKNLPTSNDELSATCFGLSSGYATVPGYATRDWQNIDASDASKGQYRLVDYTYSNGSGTLTVEGRVNSNDSPTTSTTRLTVAIPVTAPSLSDVVPGLWIRNSSFTKMGSDKVNGNIVINGCTAPTGSNQPTTANLAA